MIAHPVDEGAVLLDVHGHAGLVQLEVRVAVEVRVHRDQHPLARVIRGRFSASRRIGSC
jgi:hypothetical protein